MVFIKSPSMPQRTGQRNRKYSKGASRVNLQRHTYADPRRGPDEYRVARRNGEKKFVHLFSGNLAACKAFVENGLPPIVCVRPAAGARTCLPTYAPHLPVAGRGCRRGRLTTTCASTAPTVEALARSTRLMCAAGQAQGVQHEHIRLAGGDQVGGRKVAREQQVLQVRECLGRGR